MGIKIAKGRATRHNFHGFGMSADKVPTKWIFDVGTHMYLDIKDVLDVELEVMELRAQKYFK